MSQFDKLIEELGLIAKSMSASDAEDDKNIEAAANMDGDEGTNPEGMESENGDAVDSDDDSGEMKKSFVFKTDDGEEIEAVDGTELVKSLVARMDESESKLGQTLTAAVELIKSQGEMIKSLNEKVVKLGGEGRGRKTVVSVVEKSATLAKGNLGEGEESITPQNLLVKAMDAQRAGRLVATDVAIVEGCVNRGIEVPQHIVARIGS